MAGPWGLLAGVGGAVDGATEAHNGNRNTKIDIDETVLKTKLTGKHITLVANKPIVIEETVENDYHSDTNEKFIRNCIPRILANARRDKKRRTVNLLANHSQLLSTPPPQIMAESFFIFMLDKVEI